LIVYFSIIRKVDFIDMAGSMITYVLLKVLYNRDARIEEERTRPEANE